MYHKTSLFLKTEAPSAVKVETFANHEAEK